MLNGPKGICPFPNTVGLMQWRRSIDVSLFATWRRPRWYVYVAYVSINLISNLLCIDAILNLNKFILFFCFVAHSIIVTDHHWFHLISTNGRVHLLFSTKTDVTCSNRLAYACYVSDFFPRMIITHYPDSSSSSTPAPLVCVLCELWPITDWCPWLEGL